MPIFNKKPMRHGLRAGADRLSDFDGLKQNPGNLRARKYVPRELPPGAPLVVVLHGCTQDAAIYDMGSGWSRLADRHGFALLFPEQKPANNPSLCFNWFTAGDSQRGMGEAASIQAMILAMRKAHQLDPARTYVTGLSAGGAMAAVMLATYPELFEAGAIIAGVAYGCASGVKEAFDCMGGRAQQGSAELGASVRRASPHKGPWPRISVWQGMADQTVVPSNAEAIVLQWSHLHRLSPRPDRTETIAGYPHRVWEGRDGKIAIEQYLITGMAHGTPLDPGTDVGESGEAGPHMLDVGLSSTDHIANFFGLAPLPPEKVRRRASPKPHTPGQAGRDNVQAAIEKALRSAGLLR